eukprot:m.4606 g.4606  ORF g.4606 m.4606 type:complete len:69 (+) comp7063_c0_seq1:117-323(+)
MHGATGYGAMNHAWQLETTKYGPITTSDHEVPQLMLSREGRPLWAAVDNACGGTLQLALPERVSVGHV